MVRTRHSKKHSRHTKKHSRHSKKHFRRNKKGGFHHWKTPGDILILTKKRKYRK